MIKLRKANKWEKKDYPKAVATITIGTHEAQLTQKEIDILHRKLNKFISADKADFAQSGFVASEDVKRSEELIKTQIRCPGELIINKKMIDKMIDELDHTLTAEITCPYCGWIDVDSWELTESGEVICGGCDKEFHVERVVDVKYTSKKIK